MNGFVSLLRDVAAVLRRPKIVSCRFIKFPIAGVATSIRIRSRKARSANLRVWQDDGGEIFDSDVPPNCVAVITPLSMARLRVSLVLEPGRITHDFTITPRAIHPRFTELWMPSTVFVDHAFTVSWNVAEATGVKVEIDDGLGKPEQRVGGAADALILKPARVGPIILRFTARNDHASTAFSRIIAVQPPQPFIHVVDRVQRGRPGEQLVFSWFITDSSHAWLEAPARCERHRIGMRGSVTITLGSDPEELRLLARGNGQTRCLYLHAIPNRLSSLEAMS
jgi:hypothetical protein